MPRCADDTPDLRMAITTGQRNAPQARRPKGGRALLLACLLATTPLVFASGCLSAQRTDWSNWLDSLGAGHGNGNGNGNSSSNNGNGNNTNFNGNASTGHGDDGGHDRLGRPRPAHRLPEP